MSERVTSGVWRHYTTRPSATHRQWSAVISSIPTNCDAELTATNWENWGVSWPGTIMAQIDWKKIRKYISEGSLMVIFSLLTKAINSSTSLFARLKWLCWGRYQHMQDNDNKPTIKAFKIQPHPKQYFSRTKRVSQVRSVKYGMNIEQLSFLNWHSTVTVT